MEEKKTTLQELEEQNARLNKLVQTLAESNAALISTIKELQETNKGLQETIKEHQETIKELQEAIKELQRRLNQNSQNSSKPPSSDGYKKPKPRSLREKSGKKQGAQEGHKGSHMQLPHDPDEVKQHLPMKCLGCPHLTECLIKGTVFSCGEKRYEVNAVVTTYVTEHQSMKVSSCPCGNGKLAGEFPENIKAYLQYGSTFTVLAGLFSTYGAVSVKRIHVLLGSMFNIQLSPGTIVNMVAQCSSKVGGTLEKIKNQIINSGIANFDETGARTGGGLGWVHNSSTDQLTYQTFSQKRGQVGMEENGVLPEFSGVAMHDCWAPYWKFVRIQHAVCNAHLLRELTGIEDNNPDHKWAPDFKALLRAMKKAKEKAIAKGKQSLSSYFLHKFDQEYDRILQEAEQECPAPSPPPEKKRGRMKKGKERALIERLMALKKSVCLFIHNFNVPFDNNQAERDVRNVKTKVKVSGCFRTDAGAQHHLNVMSFISTGVKHGVNAFDSLTAAFNGDADIVLR